MTNDINAAPGAETGQQPHEDKTGWLRAQIAAQRAEAETAISHPPATDGHSAPAGLLQYVIDQCDADLAILDEHQPTRGDASDGSGTVCAVCGYEDESTSVGFSGDPYPCQTVRLLIYARRRRPGWQPDWRPQTDQERYGGTATPAYSNHVPGEPER